MGIIAIAQRHNISKNTRLIADAVTGGPAVRNQQILAATDAQMADTVNRAVARRCKRAGMTAEQTAWFLGLDTAGRAAWAAEHPEYRKKLRY